MTEQVDSASDARTANNAVRHQYRVLSDAEKVQMIAIKDKGAEFLTLLDSLQTPPEPTQFIADPENPDAEPMAVGAICTYDRGLHIARERVEEAVMWAVKHITA